MSDENGPSWPIRIGFFAVPLAVLAFVAVTRMPQAPAQRVTATLGGRGYQLDVADTPALQERGLQGFPSPGRGHGMLFVFTPPREVAFEMKTLRYPIDVAFVGVDGRVVRTVSMQPAPFGIQRSPSGVPVAYVVEAQAGSLVAEGVTEGTRFRLVRAAP